MDPDPCVFRPPGSRSVSQRSGSGSCYHPAKFVRKTLIPKKMVFSAKKTSNSLYKAFLKELSHEMDLAFDDTFD